MGFEYKIITQLTDKQTAEIEDLLVNSKTFDKKYEFNNKIFWDFDSLRTLEKYQI